MAVVARSNHAWARGPRQSWFLGLVIGIISVLVVDILGIRGLAFPAAALLGLAWVSRPRLTGIGGLVTGFGGFSTFLFGRIQLTCGADAFFPDPNCSTIDLTPWIARSAAILAAGVLLSAVGLWRARRTR